MMPRLARRAALASLLATVPALSAAQDDALRVRPADRLPTPVATPALDASAADPLTDEQLARRLARLYERQAQLLDASADGNDPRYVELLEGLVMDVRLLADAPGVRTRPRFAEAYAAVMAEYERYYGQTALDRGEIYAFREALFAATEAVDGPLLEDVSLRITIPASAPVGPYAAVFPMDMNRAVEASLRYLQRSRGHVERLRTRADTYFPMIERIMAEEGVPDELKYLAMVESALNPRARSHAAAVGMWQFIRATGAAYDLEVTDEVDDRMDPEQATRAAARHLRDLHARFGDWQLALAGYNCNPARIARAIASFEERSDRRATFWDIYEDIPRETRNYVPMFIATALVVSNPTEFGLPVTVERGPRYVYDTIPVAGGTTLSEVARLIGADLESVRALNPSLRRDRAPGSSRDPWMLRVPQGSYDAYAAELDRLAPQSARGGALYAARTVNYGTRAERPLEVGAGVSERIAAAQRPVVVPGAEDRLAEAARRLAEERGERPAEPAVEAPPVRTVADTATEAPRAESTTRRRERSVSRPTTHRVQRGEHLTMLAERYGVTVSQLRAWNELGSTTIRPGQRLRISADAPGASAAAERARGPEVTTHRVASGENLTQIARRYGVTIRQIQDWNNLSSTTIRPGQRLRIETRRTVG